MTILEYPENERNIYISSTFFPFTGADETRGEAERGPRKWGVGSTAIAIWCSEEVSNCRRLPTCFYSSTHFFSIGYFTCLRLSFYCWQVGPLSAKGSKWRNSPLKPSFLHLLLWEANAEKRIISPDWKKIIETCRSSRKRPYFFTSLTKFTNSIDKEEYILPRHTTSGW